MKIKRITKLMGVAACAGLALTGARANTILALGLSDSHAVGEIIPGAIGIPGGQLANDRADVNTLITLGLGTTASISVPGANDNPNVFKRSNNNFGTLPSASLTGAVMASGVGNGAGNVQADGTYAYITLTGTGFGYLVAKYDGPNSDAGAEVWDITGLAAGTVIQIPEYAMVMNGDLTATSGRYQITSWTLFNPNTSVPDGGTTVALLGSALTGLGLLRRKLS